MPVKKIVIVLWSLLLATTLFFIVKPQLTRADQLDDINKQLSELNDQLNKSIAATKPVESELKSMQTQIAGIKNQVAAIEADIAQKKISIDNGYKNLADNEKILSATIRDFYVKSYNDSPILILLSLDNASDATQALAFQHAKTKQDKAIITNIALSITGLEKRKADLEQEQKDLVIAKASLDDKAAKLDKIVAGAKDFQSQLSSKIAALTAQQQQFIAAKQGSLGLPTSAYTTSGGCSSDLSNGKDPGFSPKIGLFSYGVPHRVGMSQYGAKGRADAGQSYQDILSFYFPNTQITTVGTGTNIHVTGSNEYGQSFDDNWNIEEYTKHIYEIPTSWNSTALKAQAIAARSYALSVTNNGANTICPSQSCQVVKKELNSDAWVQAVNDTAGQVLTSGGTPIKAWFSSTAGGYTFSSADVFGGSTSYTRNASDASGGVSSFSDLQNNAYDKASPWFYCDWGGRSQYSGTAWLKPDEVADIVNVILLARADGGTKNHLYQTDKSNPTGTDTWDAGRVRQELSARGTTPYTSVSNASVNADFGSGRTTGVTVSGNAGSQSFSGSEFKDFFNLRAPANINIVGPLYNFELK
jgi:SpoIID/LytB domain protein